MKYNFTTSKAKSNKVKGNKQWHKTMQSYSRIQCRPVIWVATGPVVIISSIQWIYNNKTANT